MNSQIDAQEIEKKAAEATAAGGERQHGIWGDGRRPGRTENDCEQRERHQGDGRRTSDDAGAATLMGGLYNGDLNDAATVAGALNQLNTSMGALGSGPQSWRTARPHCKRAPPA